jgi:hypothetical protein
VATGWLLPGADCLTPNQMLVCPDQYHPLIPSSSEEGSHLLGYRIPNSEFRMSNSGWRIPSPGFLIPDADGNSVEPEAS